MRMKTVVVCLAVWFAAGAMCFADSFMGTWKLDPAKSRIAPGAPRNSLVRYEWEFWFETRVTVDGFDAHGRKSHSEWSGKYDGKDRPVTGSSDEDTRAYTEINDHTLKYVSKKNGRTITMGQVVISPDEKTRTVTSWTPHWYKHHRRMVKSVAFYNQV